MYGPETRRRGRRGPVRLSLAMKILNKKVSKHNKHVATCCPQEDTPMWLVTWVFPIRDIRVGFKRNKKHHSTQQCIDIEWRSVAVSWRRGYWSSRWPARKPFPGRTGFQRTLLMPWNCCRIIHCQGCVNGKWVLLMSQPTAGWDWGQIDGGSMRTGYLRLRRAIRTKGGVVSI